MGRFLDALDFIADGNPSFQRVVSGFAKHMRRKPMPDDELRPALEWARDMLVDVLDGGPATVAINPTDMETIAQ